MNEKGNFLIYDAIFAIIIVSIVISFGVIILEDSTNKYNSNNYKKPEDMLNLLEDTHYNNDYILNSLSYELDDNITSSNTLNMIDEIIRSYDNLNYTFCDITNKTIILIDKHDLKYKEIFSARKIVNNHVFELKYYK